MNKKDVYYVFNTDQDGETFMSLETEASLKKKLAEEYWGSKIVLPNEGDWQLNRMYSCTSGDLGDALIILKGPLVTPKAAKQVVEWVIN